MGPTGLQGPRGIQGPAGGPTGATGIQGPTGTSQTSYVIPIASYALETIANPVAVSDSTISYVISKPIPDAAKGLSGILSVYFDINAPGYAFGSNTAFDYGVYVDGSGVALGPLVRTARYAQTAQNSAFLLSSNGYSMGTNSIDPLAPLNIPVTLSSTASALQIGLRNSTVGLGILPSLISSGISTIYTSVGSATYSVPSTVAGSNVTGVMLYCWGSAGSVGHYDGVNTGTNGNGFAGAGGFMSGFYPCVGGTQLSVVVGGFTQGLPVITTGGGSYGYAGSGYNGIVYGGGFSAIFAGAYDPSGCLLVAGGGGGVTLNGRQIGTTYMGNGGAGGYPNGASPYQVSTNGLNVGPSIHVGGGAQTAGGTVTGGLPLGYQGQRWLAYSIGGAQNQAFGPGGGGWFAGGTGSTNYGNVIGLAGGGGGSSYYDSNRMTSVYYENGTTYTQVVTPAQISNYTLAPPGGKDVMTSFGLSNYGNGVGTNGLVVIVPYVGTAGACKIGVDARFLVV